MRKNRDLFKSAFFNLKKHYFYFVFLCILIALLHMDFSGSLDGLIGNYNDFGVEIERESVTDELLSNDAVFGTTQGVFAKIATFITGDAIAGRLAGIIERFTNNARIVALLISLLSLILTSVIDYLIIKPILVAVNRLFLENRIYNEIPPVRMLYLIRLKKWYKVVWVFIVEAFYKLLWSLTIVGYFVKHYSYFMVPYILAENPDLSANEAITLSRRMMKGNKWNCFIKEMMFQLPLTLKTLPGTIAILAIDPYLSIFAASYSLFYVLLCNPLKYTFFAEYYYDIRMKAFETAAASNTDLEPDVSLFNDKFLYEKADHLLLSSKYMDIEESREILEKPEVIQTGFLGFLARNFGLILCQNAESRAYEERSVEKVKYYIGISQLEGRSYPSRLNPYYAFKVNSFVDRMHYDRQYTLTNIIIMFFSMSMVGWVWEVLLHLVQKGSFVNRGTLYGPWLPIYGAGGVLVLMLLTRLRKHPGYTFAVTIIICGLLEYITSWVLELINGERWWDYTGYFLNINGRICGEGLLVFGIGGMTFIYMLAPMLDNLINKYSHRKMRIIATMLAAVFVLDLIYSHINPNMGEGITTVEAEMDYNHDINKYG